MMKFLKILFILLLLLFSLTILASYIFKCDSNKSCKLIGKVKINNEDYNIYNCFSLIKTATSNKGLSILKLECSKKKYEYYLDDKEDLLDSVVGNKLYNNSKYSVVDTLTNIICLPTGCFELFENSESK